MTGRTDADLDDVLTVGLRRYNGASVLEHPRTRQGG